MRDVKPAKPVAVTLSVGSESGKALEHYHLITARSDLLESTLGLTTQTCITTKTFYELPIFIF